MASGVARPVVVVAVVVNTRDVTTRDKIAVLASFISHTTSRSLPFRTSRFRPNSTVVPKIRQLGLPFSLPLC